MKNLLLHNWQAKLVSFLIAFFIWAYVKSQVDVAFFDQLLSGTLSTGH
jgi:YbbR domain-containing protein